MTVPLLPTGHYFFACRFECLHVACSPHTSSIGPPYIGPVQFSYVLPTFPHLLVVALLVVFVFLRLIFLRHLLPAEAER